MPFRPDFLGLEAFVAIAERASFHRAAAHLGLTQTALSHRMRKLEAYLGIILVHRTTRQVALTPEGVALLPRAKALLESAHGMFDDLGQAARVRQSRLAIGCLPTLAITLLPRALATFSSRHPKTEVRIYDNSASEIAERVQRGEAEFALTVLATKRSDLEIRSLAREPYVVVCERGHALARRGRVRWRDLVGEHLIRISSETGHRPLIDDALGAASERLTWTHEVQHLATAVSLAAAGVGVTVVPRSAVDLVRADNLAIVTLTAPSIARTLGVVTRRGVPVSPLGADLLAIVTAIANGKDVTASGRGRRRRNS
jgi:DNA-binding transcriptional LysR family regulator